MGAQEYLVIDPHGSQSLDTLAEAARLGYRFKRLTPPLLRGRTLAQRRAAQLRAPLQVWSRPEWCDLAGKAVAELATRAERRAHATHGDADATANATGSITELVPALVAAALAELDLIPLSAVLAYDTDRLTEREQETRPDADVADARLRAEVDSGAMTATRLAARDAAGDSHHAAIERMLATVRWLCGAQRITTDPDGRRDAKATPLLHHVLAALADAATTRLEDERAVYRTMRDALEVEIERQLRRVARDEVVELLLATARPLALRMSLVEPPTPMEWALTVATLAGAVPHTLNAVALDAIANPATLVAELERRTGVADAAELLAEHMADLERALQQTGGADADSTQSRFATYLVAEADLTAREALRKLVDKLRD